MSDESNPSSASRRLSSRTFASAWSVTAGSRRLGTNAAMPAIAWAPRCRYEVRQLTRRSPVRPHSRGITARSVRAVARGSRAQVNDELRGFPGVRRVGTDGIVRHFLRGVRSSPALEHFAVVCPAVVEDKARPGFEAWWQEATTDDVPF